MKKIKYFLIYIAALSAYNFVCILPYTGVKIISRILANILWLVPSVSKLICANIRCAFPDWEDKKVKKVGLESVYNMFWNMIEFIWIDGRKERIERCYVMLDTLKNQLQSNTAKGVRMVYACPHIGGWEGAGVMTIYYAKVKLAAIVKPIKNPYLNKFFNEKMRQSAAGFDVIFAKGAMRGCISALREGKTIAILVDQNTRVRDGGVFVDFFGLPVPSSNAPSVLQKYCEARDIPCEVIYGASLRLEDGRLCSLSQKLSKPCNEYVDEKEMLQEILNITESYIRKHPEQYLWLYHRFRNIPPDASGELKKRYPYYARVPNAHFFSKTAK